jgi:hypothetical protein
METMNGNSLGSASSPPTINGFATFRRPTKLVLADGRAETQSRVRNTVNSLPILQKFITKMNNTEQALHRNCYNNNGDDD